MNGGGDAIAGYVYDYSNILYAAVLFRWCVGVVCENIIATNGLAGGILTYQCGSGRITSCKGLNSLYDNGISVNLARYNFDPDDPTTWANFDISKCEARGNAGFGLTSYGAVGVTFRASLAAGNGNNTPVANPGGDLLPGAGGGMSAEHNAFGPDGFDHHIAIVNCTIENNWAAAIFSTAEGLRVIGTTMAGSLDPSNYLAPDAPGQITQPQYARGDGLVLVNNAVAEVDARSTVIGCARSPIFMLGNGVDKYPGLTWGGVAGSTGAPCVISQGVRRMILETTALLSGSMTQAILVANGSAGYDPAASIVEMRGRFADHGGVITGIDGVKTVWAYSVECDNTGFDLASPGIAIDISDADLVDVQGVHMTRNDPMFFGVRALNCTSARIEDVAGSFIVSAITSSGSTIVAPTLTDPTDLATAITAITAINDLLKDAGRAK
ncbi:hypothetical protein [Sphingomonas sp.]|uniref:hypothetical protein n=1 Tax=Sphingomonas sp. TaxID=28214 RepID=UPI002ED8E7BC